MMYITKRLLYSFLGVVLLLIALFFGVIMALSFGVIYETHMGRVDIPSDFKTTFIFIIGASCLVAALLGTFFYWISQKYFQKSLDVATLQLFNDVSQGVDRKFFLYLRPFITTGKLVYKNANNFSPHHIFMPTSVMKGYDGDFEYLLRRSLARYGRTIALGLPGEHIGVGRLQTTDENWKEVATILINAAEVIFCVPGPQDGTIWEIEQILGSKELKQKTVFIYPPNADDEYQDTWNKTVSILAAKNLMLPKCPESPKGIILADADAGASQEIDEGERDLLRKCAALVSERIRKSVKIRGIIFGSIQFVFFAALTILFLRFCVMY